MTDPELIRLLRCPETRQPLALAEAAVIHLLNKRISAGAVRNRGGITVVRRCDGGLVRQDGLYLYPIREAIPEMLISEAMPLDGMSSPRVLQAEPEVMTVRLVLATMPSRLPFRSKTRPSSPEAAPERQGARKS